jgi:hypothetical protein
MEIRPASPLRSIAQSSYNVAGALIASLLAATLLAQSRIRELLFRS